MLPESKRGRILPHCRLKSHLLSAPRACDTLTPCWDPAGRPISNQQPRRRANMTTNERILQAIYRAVDEVNDTLPPERKLAKSPDTVLFGRAGTLDSLGLVNLIVAAEREVQEEFGAAIALADEKAMSQRNSPFQSIATLAAYIEGLVNA
jgi:acyl carrier protein